MADTLKAQSQRDPTLKLLRKVQDGTFVAGKALAKLRRAGLVSTKVAARGKDNKYLGSDTEVKLTKAGQKYIDSMGGEAAARPKLRAKVDQSREAKIRRYHKKLGMSPIVRNKVGEKVVPIKLKGIARIKELEKKIKKGTYTREEHKEYEDWLVQDIIKAYNQHDNGSGNS